MNPSPSEKPEECPARSKLKAHNAGKFANIEERIIISSTKLTGLSYVNIILEC